MLLCTLADLRPRSRSVAGVQRIRFIDDTDLNDGIVGAWGRLYDAFVQGGDPYFEKDKDVTSDAGTLKLPSNFMQLRKVVPLVGELAGQELPDLDVHEVDTNLADLGAGAARGFRLRACELQLPGATAGQSYRI